MPDNAPSARDTSEVGSLESHLAGERPAGLMRRLAAATYDGLLVLGITMLLHFALVIARNGPLPHEISRALALGSAVVFCTFFWVRHGRTLGMQAWQLRLRSMHGGRVTIAQSLVRFTVLMPGLMLFQAADHELKFAIAGLLYFQAAYLWALFDPRKATWADRLSQTRMVQITQDSVRAP
jgi:uncharacterized RDD family membrane protein YckC